MFVRFWSFLNFYSLVSIVITDKIIALAILIYRFCLQCSMQWFFFFCLCAVVVIKFGCFFVVVFFLDLLCSLLLFLCVNSLQLMNQNVLADWFFLACNTMKLLFLLLVFWSGSKHYADIISMLSICMRFQCDKLSIRYSHI